MTDRLAGLLRHYTLTARVFHTGPFCGRHAYAGDHGHVHVIRSGRVQVRAAVHGELEVAEPSLLFYPRPADHVFVTPPDQAVDLVCAAVDLGSAAGNPLAAALPPVVLVPLAQLPMLGATLELLIAEAFGDFCGRQAAIDRLCELLLIQLLRHLMDQRMATTGLLAGLADKRLARAIAAMHDAPRQAWTLEELAGAAGMSRARFAARFRDTVGVTPGNYLSRWRVNLACALLRKGRPVGLVADDVGYGSATALARAFRASMGCSPRQWLHGRGAD